MLDLDSMEAQLDSTVPYYLPALIKELRQARQRAAEDAATIARLTQEQDAAQSAQQVLTNRAAELLDRGATAYAEGRRLHCPTCDDERCQGWNHD